MEECEALCTRIGVMVDGAPRRLAIGFGQGLGSHRLAIGFGLGLGSRRLAIGFGLGLKSRRLALGFGLGLGLGLSRVPS